MNRLIDTLTDPDIGADLRSAIRIIVGMLATFGLNVSVEQLFSVVLVMEVVLKLVRRIGTKMAGGG